MALTCCQLLLRELDPALDCDREPAVTVSQLPRPATPARGRAVTDRDGHHDSHRLFADAYLLAFTLVTEDSIFAPRRAPRAHGPAQHASDRDSQLGARYIIFKLESDHWHIVDSESASATDSDFNAIH